MLKRIPIDALLLLGQRARSSSRRRGHDDPDIERAVHTPYYQSFSSPTGQRAGSSTHSSPASVNLPSPQMHPPVLTPNEAQSQDPSPRMSANNPEPGYQFSSPLSPAHLPSPHRYEFNEYGIQPSVLSQSNVQQWNGATGEQMFASTSADQTMYDSSFGQYVSGMDGFNTYDLSDMSGGLTGLSTTPPSSSFAAVGLPFRGLDYLRNYNPSGYVPGDQDALWQSYDPGAFGYDPDLPFTPFTLSDTMSTGTPHDQHNPIHHQS